jgi:predicted  nucleic acid-binding Zn-ribbon protein
VYLFVFVFVFVLVVSTWQLTHQLSELQRLKATSEATVRQLRLELTAAQRELAAAQARDQARNEVDDAKIKGFLSKISKLDDELVAARYVRG